MLRVHFLPNQSRKHIQGSLEGRILISVDSKAVFLGSRSTSTIHPGKGQSVCSPGSDSDSGVRLLHWLHTKGPEPAPPHPSTTCGDGRPAHILTSPNSGQRRVGLRGLVKARDVTIPGRPRAGGAPGCLGSFQDGRRGWGRGGGGAGGVNRPGSREPRRRRGWRRHGLPAAGRCRGEVVFQHTLRAHRRRGDRAQDGLLCRPGRILLRAVSGQRQRRQFCEYLEKAISAVPELLQGGWVGWSGSARAPGAAEPRCGDLPDHPVLDAWIRASPGSPCVTSAGRGAQPLRLDPRSGLGRCSYPSGS